MDPKESLILVNAHLGESRCASYVRANGADPTLTWMFLLLAIS